MNNSIEEEGFIINQFKRVSNPDRPTEEAIKKARELVTLSRSSINFSTEIDNPKNAVDSALVVLKKVRLPKFKDYLYKSKLASKDIYELEKKENTI